MVLPGEVSDQHCRGAMTLKKIKGAMRLFTIVLQCVTWSTAQQSPTTLPAASYTRVNAVTYAHGKLAPLLADLYIPKRTGSLAAIILIHGGGWQGGTRTDWNRLIEPFAEHGYVGQQNTRRMYLVREHERYGLSQPSLL